MLQVEPATLIFLVYLVSSGLLILLGLPLYFGKIPPIGSTASGHARHWQTRKRGLPSIALPEDG